MDKEQHYDQVLEQLLADVDLSDDTAKRQAHMRCIEYAQEELRDDPDVNTFLTLAATRLGQMRVHLSIIKSIAPLPDGARLHLTYALEGGPVLTGNSSGLRYLGDLCAVLSEAPPATPSAPAEHVHLYEHEPPMFGTSYGLTLYNEPDEWFDRHAVAPDDATGTAPDEDIPPREIDVADILAIEFFEDAPLPPPLLLRFDKLYRVLARRRHREGDQVWARPLISGGYERMYVFSIRDDSGADFELALHLDDPNIHYFTSSDLEQVLGG